jgi:hypothetical protein
LHQRPLPGLPLLPPHPCCAAQTGPGSAACTSRSKQAQLQALR